MPKRSKWRDYWFTVSVRVICGLILGVLAGILFGAPMRRAGGILWHLSRDEVRPVLIWMGAWAIGGAIASVFTIPYWQLPWYRGIRRDDEHDEDDNAA